MDAFMLRPTHDSRKLEPTIATIRPLRNSARQAGVTRTPRISALSPPRSPLRVPSCVMRGQQQEINDPGRLTPWFTPSISWPIMPEPCVHPWINPAWCPTWKPILAARPHRRCAG